MFFSFAFCVLCFGILASISGQALVCFSFQDCFIQWRVERGVCVVGLTFDIIWLFFLWSVGSGGA